MTTLPTFRKPKSAKEFRINVAGHRWTVWLFSFRRVRKLGGVKISPNLAGRAYLGHRLIIIDSDLPQWQRIWTLVHERKHAERHERNRELDQVMWDEFEVELETLAEVWNKVCGKNIFFRELLRALWTYLTANGGNVIPRIKELVRFMRTTINGG